MEETVTLAPNSILLWLTRRSLSLQKGIHCTYGIQAELKQIL